MWKLGIRYEVLPGGSVLQRCENARRYGCDAVELPGRYFDNYLDELLAHEEELALPVSSISLGFRGSLISSDPETRRACVEDCKRLFALCHRLGAVGLVMPPVLHMDNHPRFPATVKGRPREEVEDELILPQLAELGAAASGLGVQLLLEAVNPDETDYMFTAAKAVDICRRVNHPGVGVIVDFFHLQWEKGNVPDLIRRAGAGLQHVHVAEHNRTEPGPGHLDFGPGFAALRDIGYDGYVVIECRTLSGDGHDVLPRSAAYLRGLMEEVEST